MKRRFEETYNKVAKSKQRSVVVNEHAKRQRLEAEEERRRRSAAEYEEEERSKSEEEEALWQQEEELRELMVQNFAYDLEERKGAVVRASAARSLRLFYPRDRAAKEFDYANKPAGREVDVRLDQRVEVS